VPVLVGTAVFEGRQDEGVAFVLDLTERKRAEDALYQAQMELAHVTRVATLGELTASIAHEVNQPLTAIVTNGDVCLRWLGSAESHVEEIQEALHEIVRDGNRASEVLARIRALVKRTAPVKARLHINDVIQEVLTLVQGELRRQAVAVVLALTADLPPVLADRIQLQQVLLNLVVNAIEAMRTDATPAAVLHIRTELFPPEAVLVAIQDAGVGLDPQTLERLFETFYTTKPDGLGMGLPISRSIIAAHGGHLWATAQAGGGATFQFTLPTERGGAS